MKPFCSSAAMRLAFGASAVVLALTAASEVWAWGSTGHRDIGVLAIEALPAELPAFLREPETAQAVGELAREPDRARGAGQPHDSDLDPGHFVDLDDAGRVNGGPTLAALPATREAYDGDLRAAGTDSTRSGYLPYSIADGYQQLAKDFAYWRVETAALLTTKAPEDRAWIARDLKLREALIVRDLGYWAHFVGDGSQPMHVSIHYNGWGPGPNPHNYTNDKIHGPFEGAFVHDHVALEAARADIRPYAPCAAPILSCVAAYLQTTGAQVEPLYQLWGKGGFVGDDARGRAFTAARLADGASELRDLIVDAWRLSGTETVGYQPSISVKAAEAGTPVPIDVLYGAD
jgi:hypothetical protein